MIWRYDKEDNCWRAGVWSISVNMIGFFEVLKNGLKLASQSTLTRAKAYADSCELKGSAETVFVHEDFHSWAENTTCDRITPENAFNSARLTR